MVNQNNQIKISHIASARMSPSGRQSTSSLSSSYSAAVFLTTNLTDTTNKPALSYNLWLSSSGRHTRAKQCVHSVN